MTSCVVYSLHVDGTLREMYTFKNKKQKKMDSVVLIEKALYSQLGKSTVVLCIAKICAGCL